MWIEKFVNCTPHPINIAPNSGWKEVVIPAAEKPVRITDNSVPDTTALNVRITGAGVTNMQVATIKTGIISPGELTGLPEPEQGTAYIVSRPVAMHPDAAGRDDLYVPDGQVRNDDGTVIGCRRLSRISNVTEGGDQ